MRRNVLVVCVLLACAPGVRAHGLLIPEDKSLPPLAMLNHRVSVTIDDQVARTRVEQTFRNHTDRALEATYVFPVPKGAGVDELTMWVNGKQTKGELVEADKARQIYTSIVRRTQDPALLEYMGNNLLRLRVFPIPAKGDQKVSLSFTSVAPKEGDVVGYTYPLKTDGKATRTLEEFNVTVSIKSQHPVTNIYSPTHAVTVKRQGDKEATVTFDRSQGLLDKDFQLYYASGDKDVGLTALTHKPVSAQDGYVTLLISPRVELSDRYQVPRDVVLVLDTSGSMRGAKMDQARKALKHLLAGLSPRDRFGLLNFATTVNRYEDKLLAADKEQVERAQKWVDKLEATGGTAIHDALASALELRGKDEGRSFTMVFFTDGQPTIGETDPERILKSFAARNTSNTRVFTFGVGDDVNAALLDRLAEQTRAVTTYVRPAEDIAEKASALYAKISRPVLTDLRLTATNVRLSEVYPAALPDLFHGGQLVVLGRYAGHGPAAIKLTGKVGMEEREFVYELTFPEKTNDAHDFVEQLWARRKVGYLLDQIRNNGEKKELIDEVVALAKRYGITTPYTSYLIVPDAPMPVAGPGRGNLPAVGFNGGFGGFGGGAGAGLGRAGGMMPPGLAPAKPGAPAKSVADYAKDVNRSAGTAAAARLKIEGKKLADLPAGDKAPQVLAEAREKLNTYQLAQGALRARRQAEVQTGTLGVNLAVQMQNLCNQSRLENSAVCRVAGRNCLEVGGVWIDEGFGEKTATCNVKAQSDAYFRLLEKHPELKDVFRLGNHLVWVAPSGTALVIDAKNGKDKLSDEEIDKLFAAKKK
jgi:Ca-activated chloride channel family protein